MDVGEPFAQIVVPAAYRLLVDGAGLDVGKRLRLARLVEHQIHHKIGLPRRLVRSEVSDLDDPGMTKLRKKPALRLEAPLHLLVVLLVGEELDGVTGTEMRVLRLVDLAHAAFPEKADNVIAANRHRIVLSVHGTL